MGRVIHFETTAEDMERAIKFYKEVFAWEIENANMPGGEYWLIKTGDGDGIDGAIMPKTYWPQAVLNTVAVEDIDTAIASVKKSGGTIVNEKQEIPGVGYHIYVKDTEGNMLGLIQETSHT